MKINNDTDNFGIKEIARLANVSIATVDRVIHNRAGVSRKTKENIDRIIKELDYQPNIFARRLASRKILNFAALIPEVSEETDFWQAPLNGILDAEAEIKRNGININKYFFDLNKKESFLKQSKLLLESNPDGILLAPSFVEESAAFLKSCDELGIPYVLINSDLPDQNSLCYIGPDLFHSGFLGAHLSNYLINEDDKILIVNIAKEIEKHHELLKKEDGIRQYFENSNKKVTLLKGDIRNTDFASVAEALSAFLEKDPDIKLIFVTNSRVSSIARYLDKLNKPHVFLIGYDYIKENIHYLEKGTIDFLICDKPKEQGFRGIMALYQNLVFNAVVEDIHFMPIDIITKENYKFYRN